MIKKWVLRTPNIKNFCSRYIAETTLVEGELLEVIMRPHKKGRSLEQNDLFHSWCGSIADKTGHTKGEIKDYLLESVFGAEDYVNLAGKKRSRVRSTSGMNTKDMSELIERTIQLGIELGADVPEVIHE